MNQDDTRYYDCCACCLPDGIAHEDHIAAGGHIQPNRHETRCDQHQGVRNAVADTDSQTGNETEGHTWLQGGWMQTYTGLQFYPLAPRASQIDPVDIAHALGLICRYGGHVRWFYSVAEHCVLMSHAVAPQYALAALLHDATEAYVGDMVRPLKLSMPAYCAAEDRVAEAIATRFGTSAAMPASVKEADSRILLDERAVLMAQPPVPWDVENLEPLGVEIQCWDPETAARKYIERLDELLVTRPDLSPPALAPH